LFGVSVICEMASRRTSARTRRTCARAKFSLSSAFEALVFELRW